MTTPMAVDKAKAPKIDVDEFLALAISETPQELHSFFESFRTLYSRKYVSEHAFTDMNSADHLVVACRLWHQLTNKLFEFFDHPLTRPYRVDVFNKFVRDFEAKLNQLRLVEMGVKVSKEIDSEYCIFWFNSLQSCLASRSPSGGTSARTGGCPPQHESLPRHEPPAPTRALVVEGIVRGS